MWHAHQYCFFVTLAQGLSWFMGIVVLLGLLKLPFVIVSAWISLFAQIVAFTHAGTTEGSLWEGGMGACLASPQVCVCVCVQLALKCVCVCVCVCKQNCNKEGRLKLHTSLMFPVQCNHMETSQICSKRRVL